MRPNKHKSFPSAGQYAVYPAHVSLASQDKVIVRVMNVIRNHDFYGEVAESQFLKYPIGYNCATWQTYLFREVKRKDLSKLKKKF